MRELIPVVSGGTEKLKAIGFTSNTFCSPSKGETETTLKGIVVKVKVYGDARYSPVVDRTVACTVTVYSVFAASPFDG